MQVARTEAQCADRAFFETPYCSRCVLSGSVGFTGALARRAWLPLRMLHCVACQCAVQFWKLYKNK